MIHKINEPKFEPEMHDSRGQTGKRPPISQEIQQPSNLATNPVVSSDNRVAAAYLSAAAVAAAAVQQQALAANQSLPSYVQPYSQSSRLATHPVNPFINNTEPHLGAHTNPSTSCNIYEAAPRPQTMMREEERPAHLSGSRAVPTWGTTTAPPSDNSTTVSR